MNVIWKYLRGDKALWIAVIGLSVFSLLAIYSSTGTLAYKEQHGNTEYYVQRHLLLLVCAWVFMYAAHSIRYTFYSKISMLLLFIAIPLLFFVALKGPEINEARRWLILPVINTTFQPSDLGKLALVMYIARVLSKSQKFIKERKPFIHIMLVTLVVVSLIAPANLSTALLVTMTAYLMMFVGRIRTRYLLGTALGGLTLVTLFVVILSITPQDKLESFGRFATWKNRIERFTGQAELTEGEDFQAEQSKIAVASGGLFGKMPGNSTQRNILPHPYSDFIYAIIVEEYGFVGGVVIMMIYLTIFYRCIHLARKCEGTFGSFLALGIGILITAQALMNMAVAVGAMPVTGQVLPFLSMGGTSLWLTCFGLGIVLSVSVEVEKHGHRIDHKDDNRMLSAEEIAASMAKDEDSNVKTNTEGDPL